MLRVRASADPPNLIRLAPAKGVIVTSRRALTISTFTAVVLATTSCSLVGSEDDGKARGGGGGAEPTTVVLLTHSDFTLPEEVVAQFEDESGYDLEVRPSNGVGELVNLVVDEAGNPSGDVVFGVDNTFGSRVLGSDALTAYDGDLPAGVDQYALDGDDDGALVPVDNGNVCVNVDDAWFADKGIDPPQGLDDLTDPAYQGLFVTPGAATSSPGLAFLLTTISAYGDDWPGYWADLLANDVEIVPDWSEAYYGGFTQGEGDRPIVLSYDSSPAFTVDKKAKTTSTSALLDTCYQQVEYAGVLDGAENPDGAAALVDFLVGPQVQASLPEGMFVFPVAEGTPIPDDWAAYAQRPTDPYEVDPAEIEANREDWLLEWTDVISR